MVIHKITPFLDYNKLLKSFDTQLNEQTVQNSIKVNKVEAMNKKLILKNSEDLPTAFDFGFIFQNDSMASKPINVRWNRTGSWSF